MPFLTKLVEDNVRRFRFLRWGAASGFGVVLVVLCVLLKSRGLMDDTNVPAHSSRVGGVRFIVVAKCSEESSDIVVNELQRRGILSNAIGSLMWTVSVREDEFEEASRIIQRIDRRDVLLQKRIKGN